MALGACPWSQRPVRTCPAVAAGKAAGLSAAETELLLPRGPADLAALLSRRHDTLALEPAAQHTMVLRAAGPGGAPPRPHVLDLGCYDRSGERLVRRDRI